MSFPQYQIFLRGKVVSRRPNPQLGGPGYAFLSGSSPSTCPAWGGGALPVATSPSGCLSGSFDHTSLTKTSNSGYHQGGNFPVFRPKYSQYFELCYTCKFLSQNQILCRPGKVMQIQVFCDMAPCYLVLNNVSQLSSSETYYPDNNNNNNNNTYYL